MIRTYSNESQVEEMVLSELFRGRLRTLSTAATKLRRSVKLAAIPCQYLSFSRDLRILTFKSLLEEFFVRFQIAVPHCEQNWSSRQPTKSRMYTLLRRIPYVGPRHH